MGRKVRQPADGQAEGGAKKPRRRTRASARGPGVEAARPGRSPSDGETPPDVGQATDGRADSFYAELFTPEELADLAQTEAEPSLEDEIALLRVAIRRGSPTRSAWRRSVGRSSGLPKR